jgi:metallophosphoesterase (TIGR00282 family)
VHKVRILFVGDIMGSPGRRAAGKLLEDLRSRLDCGFVIVNGENAAGGLGITVPTATALLGSGADVLTLGNHTFAKRAVAPYLDDEIRILRPANYPPGVAGRGWGIYQTTAGESIAVVNLMGRTFMDAVDCPFRAANAILAEIGGKAKVIIVDMHAEATSEKIAMGWHLDGRVSAVIGTHTHVQTSDERVLPCGTAYLTDVGMTGVMDSVLGLDSAVAVERFLTRVPGKFQLAEGPACLHGVVIEVDVETGRAISIERVVEEE